ncbi:MAG: efflux RND transporter periplasmic adaptor subunit [Planctomycetaceae bacterium]|nr:efflux RND transporter periplasmic adaptor subunit [Planctomycetaceae bacterium]
MSRLHSWLLLFVVWAVIGDLARAQEDPAPGFTEPYSTVSVATTETGLLMTLNVKEGDRVTTGQALAVLDDDLQLSHLAITQQQAEGQGKLNIAQAEHALQKRRNEKLAQLAQAGQAHPEEIERAKAELRVAEGRVLAEEEELKLLKAQVERARLMLKKRTVFAPLDGVVSEVIKRPGEFISPTTPQVVVIVQLDRLKATFLVQRTQREGLKLNQPVQVRMIDTEEMIPGTIEHISPITDAESGTTVVRVLIDNRDGRHRSGEKCQLEPSPGPVASERLRFPK